MLGDLARLGDGLPRQCHLVGEEGLLGGVSVLREYLRPPLTYRVALHFHLMLYTLPYQGASTRGDCRA